MDDTPETQDARAAVTRRDCLKTTAVLAASAIVSGCAGTTRSTAATPVGRTEMTDTPYDALIVGGGPAGLAAALALGRACRRVLVCDAGTPRNAAATHIHNFVTRDGTPPEKFREVGRAQLAQYETVELRETRVESITGARGAFVAETGLGPVRARRVVLATGMIDESLPIPGFAEAWGRSIFQCPYCHGYEVRGRRWGYLALGPEGVARGFPALLRSWSDDVVVFTQGAFEVADAQVGALRGAGITVEPRRIARLVVANEHLTHIELEGGERIACEVLYAHPPQRQVGVVRRLGLEVDDLGYVRADPMTRQTSTPGIYAAGDLTSRAQGAIFAAATGTHAAGMLNHDLAVAALESPQPV